MNLQNHGRNRPSLRSYLSATKLSLNIRPSLLCRLPNFSLFHPNFRPSPLIKRRSIESPLPPLQSRSNLLSAIISTRITTHLYLRTNTSLLHQYKTLRSQPHNGNPLHQRLHLLLRHSPRSPLSPYLKLKEVKIQTFLNLRNPRSNSIKRINLVHSLYRSLLRITPKVEAYRGVSKKRVSCSSEI